MWSWTNHSSTEFSVYLFCFVNFGVIPGSALPLLLALCSEMTSDKLGSPYEMPRVKPESAACKTNGLPSVLSSVLSLCSEFSDPADRTKE